MALKFSKLAEIYEQLEKTSSSNKMRELLSAFLKKVPTSDIESVSYLTLGQIASEFSDINLGLADKMVLRAIVSATNSSTEKVTKLYKKKGDAGLVAQELVGRQRKQLSVKDVFAKLHEIAKAGGVGSQEKKISILSQLLKNASPLEAKYICRIVLSTLRLGSGYKILLAALAIAYTGKKENQKILENAYSVSPDVGIIAKTLVTKGIKAVSRIGVQVGRPIESMLCQRVSMLSQVPDKVGTPFAVEEKYDGERIQVHKQGKNITLFSRRLENITDQFPDVVSEIRKNIKAKSAVIDGEVMPIDPKTGKLRPFQILMSRRRKHGVAEYVKKIPVVYFVFDILYLNGKSLIATPYKKRYASIKKVVKKGKKVKLAARIMCDNPGCAEELFNKVVDHGGEGIIIKNLKGMYEAGSRGWQWIKWKPEYSKKLRDTFDLVVVGAFYGTGKRGGMLSSYLCAVYNPSKDRFETFTKVASGFKDKDLASIPKKLAKFRRINKHARVSVKKSMTPDVWFTPGIVIEVLGAEITKSPNHTAADGLALRFPRFVRLRDKKPEQATTVKEIKRMHG